jgi:beta-galactosidase
MNKLLKAAVLLVVCFALAGCRENVPGLFEKQIFNDDWLFFLLENGTSEDQFFHPDFDDSGWEQVSIPHTPRLEPLLVNDQWQGTCWYRKKFKLPSELKQRKLYLSFEGAMNVADVWINGVHKIKHQGGYLPFVIDFSDEANWQGDNQVVVRLDNRDNPVTGPKPLEILDFNTYGGIYRNVWLSSKAPLHITDPVFADREASGGVFVSFPEVSLSRATIAVKTHVLNEHSRKEAFHITQSLFKGEQLIQEFVGEQVLLSPGEDAAFLNELDVEEPELWSPQHPHLYFLETAVMQGEKIIDQETTRIGIKTMEFRDQSFFLNGEELFLRGVNRHQEYPFVGYALSDNAQYRDAKKIKDAGFDYVRLSHYPHSDAFMDACDELGLMTIDAILGWQYYSDSSSFHEHVFNTVRDMIRRDRNHASVLAWEVSLNESWMPEYFIDSLNRIAHREFPGDQCFTAGWQEYGYDIYLQARQHRVGRPHHSVQKPYVVSEYGDWEYYAMNAGLNQDSWDDLIQEERSSRQLRGFGQERLLQQARNIQEAHNDNFSTPAFADGYWVMFDYNRGYADDLEASGIMDIFRIPKSSFYFFQSQRDASDPFGSPMVHIANTLPDKKGEIRVFSNCDEVELFSNGTSAGRQSPDRDQFSNRLAHPPFTFDASSFESGELIARAYLNGEQAVVMVQPRPREASKIRLEVDLSGRDLQSGSKDLIFIYASVVDDAGTVVPDPDRKITFTLEGDARFIGPNPAGTEAGIATILLQAGKMPGLLQINASSGGLSPESIQVEMKNVH